MTTADGQAEGQEAALASQALRRSLTQGEREFAQALERIFGSGEHDFVRVAAALEGARVPRPSGSAGTWTLDVLRQELVRLNASLDAPADEATESLPVRGRR